MRGIWVALALVACVKSTEVECGDGRVCPPGNTCDDDNHRCLSPEQVAACDGHAEGDTCTLATVSGICHAGVCEPLVCGDGVRTGTEACDGTDLGSADCTTAGFYDPAGLACTEFCTFDTSQCTGFCGDGVVDGPELCDGTPPPQTCVDDGFDAGALGCSASCAASFASCGKFGWRPELTGVSFTEAIAGANRNDLWVAGSAGADGAVAHFDGAAWTPATIAPGKPLFAISEAAPGDVWAIGSATVQHLAAGQWSAVAGVPAGPYVDVLALAPDDVLVATTKGLLQFDGSTWQVVGGRVASLTTVRATSATDIWVTQTDGTIQQWNGTSWQPVAGVTGVHRVAPLSPTDAWAIGGDAQGNFTARWNGSAWTTFRDLEPGPPLTVLALADNNVWVSYNGGSARHFDGFHWTPFEELAGNDQTFEQMVALPDELAAVTADGLAYRFTGQLYARIQTGDVIGASAEWSDTADDVFVADQQGNIIHYDGSIFLDSTKIATGRLAGMWGNGPTDVWVGVNGAPSMHFDGSTWSTPADAPVAHVIWGSSTSDMWFGGPTITHFDGTIFTDSLDVSPIALTGSAPDDVWAAVNTTTGTDVYGFDGSAWSAPMSLPNKITSLAVLAPDDVFATADAHTILHYDGVAWSSTEVLALDPLTLSSATAPDDVFAASDLELFHFDGTSWAQVRAPADPALQTGSIVGLLAHRGYIDILYLTASPNPQQVRQLVRTRPWNCRAKETDCTDGIDDDCDGLVDGDDPDCP